MYFWPEQFNFLLWLHLSMFKILAHEANYITLSHMNPANLWSLNLKKML